MPGDGRTRAERPKLRAVAGWGRMGSLPILTVRLNEFPFFGHPCEGIALTLDMSDSGERQM